MTRDEFGEKMQREREVQSNSRRAMSNFPKVLGGPKGVDGSACNNTVQFISGPGSNNDAFVALDPALVGQVRADG